MTTRMQARREFGLRVEHCAVITQIIFNSNDPVGDVGRLVGLEMPEQRQLREIDGVFHRIDPKDPLVENINGNDLVAML